MKNLVKKTYNSIYLILNKWGRFCVARNTTFFLSSISVGTNQCFLKNATLHKSRIVVNGTGNKIYIKGAVFNTFIEVYGDNNVIFFRKNSEVHDAKIVVRGEQCGLYIGEKSTFGGGKMIVMGNGNKIDIGRGCMMSDQIELWATDSHPIYNEDKQVINASKPIRVGDFVWIGTRSSVLKGVTIGEGAVIGMGSTVARDVPNYCIGVGNPIKIVKENITWSREYICV